MSARVLFCLALCVACDCADKNLCPEPFVEGDFECECPPEWELEDGWCILPDGGRVPIPGVDAAVDSGTDASVATDASLEEDAAAADVGTDAAPEDAGTDAGPEEHDAGSDAGFCYSEAEEYPVASCNPSEPWRVECPAVCDGASFRAVCSETLEGGDCRVEAACLGLPGDPAAFETCEAEVLCLTRLEPCESATDCSPSCSGGWRVGCDFHAPASRRVCAYYDEG